MKYKEYFRDAAGGFVEGVVKGIHAPGYLLKKAGIFEYSTTEAYDNGTKRISIGNRDSKLYQVGAGFGDAAGLALLVVDRSLIVPAATLFFDCLKNLLPKENMELEKLI